MIEIRGLVDAVSSLGDVCRRIVLGWTANETQVDVDGEYRPPLGAAGNALDALVGHRLAEAAVLRFLRDVAAYLTRKLGAP